MSKTTIEWTQRPGTIGETWNPTTGCNKVDRGCKHCYALTMHRRLQAMGQAKYAQDFLAGAVPQEDTLELPFRWKRPRTVFVNSMSDLFHEAVPFDFIYRVFNTIAATGQHTYLILTKRPEVALSFSRYYASLGVTEQGTWPGNIWMGVSVNDQPSAELRIPYLLQLPAAKIFVSYEPATGPVNFDRLDADRAGHKEFCMIDALTGRQTDMGRPWYDVRKLDWVIMGGESGPHATPMNPNWVRRVRDDCAKAKVPFFFKQWGTWEYLPASLCEWPDNMIRRTKGVSGHKIDSQVHLEFP